MKYLCWFAIIAVLLWSMTFGTYDILGFKKCDWCGDYVAKGERTTFEDKYILCDRCVSELGNAALDMVKARRESK